MASARWRRRRRIGCVLPVVVLALLAVLVATGWPGVGAVASLLGALVIATLVVTVILLGARVLRSTAAPVGELIDAAGRVQSGDYTARVTETGPTELRSLARAFNQMSERLGRTDQQRRSLMADVSHELRTPLTVIQGQLEAIRDGIYPADAEHLGPALDQVVVLDRLVDDLRTLALTESGSLHLAREPTDLGALVTETVHGFDTAVRSADISLSVTVATDLPRVALDPARIGGVIRNLVANAVRYTPPGGVVTLPCNVRSPRM